MAATQAQTSKKKKATKAKAGAPKPKAPPRSEVPMMAALRAEHRHMASVMELMAQQLDAVAEGDLVDTHMLYESMDYMLSWPDRYHHPREDLIYGRVADIDSSAADNVDSLQREHDDMAGRGREV
ncbi:MAG: hypothetical protein ABJK20_00975, partial [Halieaceae bacterium]